MDNNQFNLLNRISTYNEYANNHKEPQEVNILSFLSENKYISPRFTTTETFYSITEKGRAALFQHKSKIDVDEQIKSMSLNVNSIDTGLKDERIERKKGDHRNSIISYISILIALISLLFQTFPFVRDFLTSVFS